MKLNYLTLLILKLIHSAKISISAIIRANSLGKEFEDAYLFVRVLVFQSKHPIILNYKDQLTPIRQQLGYTDSKFRKLLKSGIRHNLIKIEGDHLRLHSGNQDWEFKPRKGNDYRVVGDIQKARKLILVENYYHKQYSEIKSKERQTQLSVNKGVSPSQISEYNSSVPNNNISISCLGICKLLHLKSTSQAKRIIDCLAEQRLISLSKNRRLISEKEYIRLKFTDKKKNLRQSNNRYYFVLASTFELNYNTRRTIIKSAFDFIPEWAKVLVADKGYSKEYIDRQVG